MAYCERPSTQLLREACVRPPGARLPGSKTLPEPALRHQPEAVPGAGAQKAALSGLPVILIEGQDLPGCPRPSHLPAHPCLRLDPQPGLQAACPPLHLPVAGSPRPITHRPPSSVHMDTGPACLRPRLGEALLRRPSFNLRVGTIPWRRPWLPTPVFWPGQFHGLYSPWGHKGSDMTERLSPLCSSKISFSSIHNSYCYIFLR